ncbi:MAG: FAD-dependent oxidoreductase [Pseudomonadota bacterium]
MIQPQKTLPVIIIGAGPVGLLSALALAKQGIAVLVLEAEPGLTIDLRAGTFHPPTLEMMAPLGITDRLEETGIKVARWQARDFQEGLIVEWDLSLLKNDTPYPYRLHLEQHRLTPILLDMLAAYPHAQVRFSTRFTGYTQDTGSVTVSAESATATEKFDGSWLIGADGGRSAVRKATGIEFTGYTWPERYSVMSTTEDLAQYGYADNAYISDPEQWIAVFRMPDQGPPGLWRLTIPVKGEMPDEEILAPAYAQKIMSRLLNREGPFPMVHQNVYRVHQRVAESFRAGRVLLAGDAAHVNNPLGGFGLNSGIHDAMNLAEKLGAVIRDKVPDSTLDLYSSERRAANIEYVQNMSVKNKQNLEEADPVKRSHRIDSLRKIAADPALARDFLLGSSMLKSFR